MVKQNDLIPDQVLCSDAARTQQTLELLELVPVPVELQRGLYLAQADVMMRTITRQTGDYLLLVAHNPGIAVLAERLVSTAPSDPEFRNFPTCATLVADFDIAAWSKMKIGTGAVRHFIVPRSLTE
jgi:phosphohistidine phosphatase